MNADRPMESLPREWALSTLGDMCERPEYGWTTAADFKSGNLRLLRTTDITKGSIDWNTVPFCEQEPARPDKYKLNSGDIVISRAGSVGVSALIQECPTAVFASYLIRFRPKKLIHPQYVLHFLRSPAYWRAIAKSSAGIALQNVNAKKLAAIELPLAPLREQKRIATKIEKHFTRLDAAVAALKRIQANLKRYRASVLKAACEGRLVPTEAELAHREGRDYEPADRLLARILEERRAKWEADQLAKMQTAGKPPKDDKWKAKYQESSTPDTSDLSELPEGWTWVLTNQIAAIQGGIQKQPKRTPKNNAFPFLRVANVLRGRLDLSEIHQIELFGGELQKLHLEVGDLLIVEGNGSASEIGRMAFWSGAIKDCVHQNHIIRARLLGGVLAPYVSAYWNSTEGASRVLAEASSTSGLYTLSVTKVGHLPIPLPPLSEQERIVAEIDRRLSVIDELASIVHANMKRAERLRQAILKRAFEGKLVPQDPNDEPAGALLERIRAERAKAEQTRAPRGERSRRATSMGQRTKAEL